MNHQASDVMGRLVRIPIEFASITTGGYLERDGRGRKSAKIGSPLHGSARLEEIRLPDSIRLPLAGGMLTEAMPFEVNTQARTIGYSFAPN